MKAIKQYFPVVLFIMLYKVVLTFEPVDEILECNFLVQLYPWFKFYFPLFLGIVMLIISLKQRKINFKPRLKLNHNITIQIKAIEQNFPVVLFIMLYKVVITFFGSR